MPKVLGILILLAIPIMFFLFTEGRDTIVPIPGVNEGKPLVFFGEQVPLRVDIADTPSERAQGLSGRTELGATEGLLFVFDESGYHGIWMKDMRIPIDIIWVDETFRVVHIERNVHPDTYPKIFEPNQPARFVVETNSNYAESFKINVGDSVTIPPSAIPADLRN